MKTMTTDEALQEIIRRLQLDCAQQVSEGSGNSVSTVYNWRNHGVKKPHLLTFKRFLDYYGYRLEVLGKEDIPIQRIEDPHPTYIPGG
tara:strand:- start:22254 stop:22517 length:264 start_codon:yes stop_codon:yes gene_type:complete